MSTFSTPAIMLRRIDHGDYDLIITFLSLHNGKRTVIAKYAKKSVKRFSGILELFSVLHIVCKAGRGSLPVLQEAALIQPFPGIRKDIRKTAYASYWSEIINQWAEEGKNQTHLYELFHHVLNSLNQGHTSVEALSILFQIRFLTLAGLSPNLSACVTCRKSIERIKDIKIMFDLAKGGLVCEMCANGAKSQLTFSKGTLKQLIWVNSKELKKTERVKFTPQALKEGLGFLEAFVPYHLGKEPRSLKFLHEIRR